VDVHRTRRVLVALTALLTAATVAFAGTIGFVGLVVPHIVRLVFGPAHRGVLPLSALTGALLLVVADTLARVLAPPSEVPIGLLTSMLGAPFFLVLVLRSRQVQI
jgi:iron complex transport system permease protein